MQTASLINHVMIESSQPTPEIGMPATICDWTDRTPATVIEVRRFKSGARKGEPCAVVVQEDSYRRTDKLGMSDCQTYEYERNPSGCTREFKVGRDGRYKGLTLGHRERYYDYSF
jgi:hypothetical protein